VSFLEEAVSARNIMRLFDSVTHERAKNLPQFTPTIPDDHIAGEPLKFPHGNSQKSQKPDGWHPHHM